MKRPLFWSAISFALGEVLYFYSYGTIQKSIISVMLFCCIIIFAKTRKDYIWCLFFVMILGCLTPVLFECGKYKDNRGKYIEGEHYDIFTNGVSRELKRNIRGSGVIVDVYETLEGKISVKVKVTDSIINGKKYSEYYINIYDVLLDNKVKIGSGIYFKGLFSTYEGKTNPGEFSYNEYNANRYIYYYAYYKELELFREYKFDMGIIGKSYYNMLWSLNSFREEIRNRIYYIYQKETADFYTGLLIGDKKNIDEDILELYRRAGIAHILAISGLHISLIGGMVYKLLKKLGLKFAGSGFLTVVLLLMYGIITGNSGSTIRAIVMLSYWMFGQIVGKKTDMLTAMAISLFIILFLNPNMIKDTGIHISFAAMFGVVCSAWLIKKINGTRKFKRFYKKHKFFAKIIYSLLSSLVISVFTAPVLGANYYEISLFSFLLNLVVLPLMSIVVVSGILAIMCSYINLRGVWIFVTLGEKITQLYTHLCKFIVLKNIGIYNTGRIKIYQIIIYYALIMLCFVLCNEKIIRYFRDSLYRRFRLWISRKTILCINISIAIVFLVFGTCFLSVNPLMKVENITFLDVGQGDGILIKTKSKINIMIDGGSSTDLKIGENVIVPALKYKGMSNIDYWFVSHMDLDHVSGLIYVLEKGDLVGVRISNIVLSKYIVKEEIFDYIELLAKDNNIKIMYVDENFILRDEEVEINVMHPNKNYEVDDANDMSLCLLYKSKKISILLTGDIGKAGMGELTRKNEMHSKNNAYNEIDFLKLPHHGSRNSYNEEFYNKYTYKYGVISCGYKNRYKHPHEEIIDVLNRNSIKILRTDYMGAIEIYAK